MPSSLRRKLMKRRYLAQGGGPQCLDFLDSFVVPAVAGSVNRQACPFSIKSRYYSGTWGSFMIISDLCAHRAGSP